MSRVCDLSGKAFQNGHRISHSNIKTNHIFQPNLHKKRCWSAELNRFVTLKVSSHAIRTIDKIGLDSYARKVGLKLK